MAKCHDTLFHGSECSCQRGAKGLAVYIGISSFSIWPISNSKMRTYSLYPEQVQRPINEKEMMHTNAEQIRNEHGRIVIYSIRVLVSYALRAFIEIILCTLY